MTRPGNDLITDCPHPHSHSEVDAVFALQRDLLNVSLAHSQQTDDGSDQDGEVSQDIGAPDLWDLTGQNWAGF